MTSTGINYSTPTSASATSASPPVVGPKVKGKSRVSKAEAPLTLCGDADGFLDWSSQLPSFDKNEQHNVAMGVDGSLTASYDAVYRSRSNRWTVGYSADGQDASAFIHRARNSSVNVSSIIPETASSENNSSVDSDTEEQLFVSSDDDYDCWDFFNQEPIPLLRRALLDIVEDCAGQLLPENEISNPSLIDKNDEDEKTEYYEPSADEDEEDEEPNGDDEGDAAVPSADASPTSSCDILHETEASSADAPLPETSREEGNTLLTDSKGKQRADPVGWIDESNFVRRSLRKRKHVETQEWDDEDDECIEDEGNAEEEEEKKPPRKSGRTKGVKVGPADKLSAAFLRHYFDMEYLHPRDKNWGCPCPIWMHLENGACQERYNADDLFPHLNKHGKVYAAGHSGAAPPCVSEECDWDGEAASFGRHVHDIHMKAKTVLCPCGGRASRDDHGQIKRHLRSGSHAQELKKKGITKYRNVDDQYLLAEEARWRRDTIVVDKTRGRRPRKIA